MNQHAENAQHNTLRALILAGFVLLSLAYASAAPILEKNDEDHHLAMVIHYATGGSMPVQQPGEQTRWMQEGSQPPLYYWLAALPARLFDTRDFDVEAQPNASPQYSPNAPSNKNKHLLTPQKFAFGYTGSMLAAYALRVLSILAGVVIVWFTYKLALRITANARIALLAMGLVAFNPMLLTVTSAVSNDGLVIALNAVAMWLLVDSVMGRVTMSRALALGVLIGLATLAKVSGTLLLPVAGLALIAQALRVEKRAVLDWRSYRYAFVVAVVWAAIAGWWFARNVALYQELTGTAMMVQVAGPRTVPIDPIGEFRSYRMTFFGIFGQTNVPMARPLYVLWDAFLVVAAAGLLMAWRAHWRQLQSDARIAYLAMVLHIGLVIASALLWTTMVVASHGRLLFPALPSIATLIAIGMAYWVERLKLPKASLAGVIVPFAGVAAIVPMAVIAPAYTPPLVSALPADAIPAQMKMAPFAEVLGYRMTPKDARPGDEVRVAVYLRALQPTPSNYLFSTQLFGRDNAPLTRFDTYNGGGLLPSSEWKPGQMWVEEMDLRIPPDASAPAILRLQFTLFNPYFGEFADNIDANGQLGSPLFDGSTLLPATAPAGTQPLATFGNVVALQDLDFGTPQAGQPLTVTLQWQPLAQAARDYTIFLHLIDGHGKMVAQSDAPPDAGQFPSTRWVKDAEFSEQRVLTLPADLPAGAYRLSIGLYDAETGERVPAVDAQGVALADNIFNANTFQIGE